MAGVGNWRTIPEPASEPAAHTPCHSFRTLRAAVEQTATGTSKSAVSRRFVAATERSLAELLVADLSSLDLVALLVDGVRVAENCCVVALGITLDGTKVPLGLAEGATENATVVRDLLTGLRDRGLDTTRPILVVIDGAKALRRAVDDVFDHPVIQRCQLHKLRSHRPAARGGCLGRGQDAPCLSPCRPADRSGRVGDPDPRAGPLPPRRRRILARGPGRDPDDPPARRTTHARPHAQVDNSIESMIAICHDHAANVKRWRDGQMVLRWVAAGWARPPPSSAASTATCTCRRCAPRSTRPSLLSHPPRRMPPDHPWAATKVPR